MAKLKIFSTPYPFGETHYVGVRSSDVYVATTSMTDAGILVGNANGPGMDDIVLSPVHKSEQLSPDLLTKLEGNRDKVFDAYGNELLDERYLKARDKLHKEREMRKTKRGKKHAQRRARAEILSDGPGHCVIRVLKPTESQEAKIKKAIELLRNAGLKTIAIIGTLEE